MLLEIKLQRTSAFSLEEFALLIARLMQLEKQGILESEFIKLL